VWLEVALVTVAALLGIGATSLIAYHDPDGGGVGIGGVTLLALAVAALPFRRRYPLGALAVAFATTLAYVSLGYHGGPIWLPLIGTLVQLVLVGRRREAIVTLVVGYVCFSWLGWLIGRTDPPPVVGLVALAAWLVALISVAEAVRSRRERAAEAARSQAEELRRRASDERLRIARELHDVVAHNMSLISIQAGVALHLMDTNPDQVRTSLTAIKDASKEALVELRSILGVLRLVDEESESASDAGSPAPRSPVPTLQRLADLVDRARAAGLDVDVQVDGDLGDLAALPRQVDLAAFRIVQESLTNVARHSDDPAATVRLDARDGGLAVDILDEGSARVRPADDLPRGGNGLPGMRERAAAVGGRLEAGPRPGRGFAVRAWLPIDHDRDGDKGDKGEDGDKGDDGDGGNE
jgi:signal transduction histidine kinase